VSHPIGGQGEHPRQPLFPYDESGVVFNNSISASDLLRKVLASAPRYKFSVRTSRGRSASG
jgi:hypothetical protein